MRIEALRDHTAAVSVGGGERGVDDYIDATLVELQTGRRLRGAKPGCVRRHRGAWYYANQKCSELFRIQIWCYVSPDLESDNKANLGSKFCLHEVQKCEADKPGSLRNTKFSMTV